MKADTFFKAMGGIDDRYLNVDVPARRTGRESAADAPAETLPPLEYGSVKETAGSRRKAVLLRVISGACAAAACIAGGAVLLKHFSADEYTYMQAGTDMSETVQASQVPSGRNFLGGSGSFTVLNQNPMIFADDENLYAGYGGQYCPRGGTKWRQLCEKTGCKHGSDDCILGEYFYHGARIKKGTDGLILAKGSLISALHDDGSTTALADICKIYPEFDYEPESFAYADVVQRTEDVLFFDVTFNTQTEEGIRKTALYNIRTGARTDLAAGTAAVCWQDETAPDNIWLVTPWESRPVLYSAETLQPCGGLAECVDGQSCIADSGLLYYAAASGQYCCFDPKTGAATVLNDDWHSVAFVCFGHQLYTVDRNRNCVIRANYDLTEMETFAADSQVRLRELVYADGARIVVNAYAADNLHDEFVVCFDAETGKQIKD